MSNHAKVIAILVARSGKRGELRTLLDGMVAPSRKESGNLRYDLWRDQADPNRFVLDELYADDDAVAAHRGTPHFQTSGVLRWACSTTKLPDARSACLT